METLQPKIRFPEFEGNCEKKKLGDFTTWSSGGTPSKDNDNYWNGNIPWISASSMRGIVYSNSELKITELGLKKGSRLAKKGSMLLLVRGSMLFNKIPVGIAGIDVAFNQDLKSITVDENSTSDYILHWFFNKEPILLNMVTGTGIGAGKLDLKDLKDLDIILPSLEEQTKIANFLTAIDEKINLLKEKETTLEEYKKGMMQKIFNQEIRFKDDNGNNFEDWEEKSLGEVTVKKSSNISANKIEENTGDYIIYGASGILKTVDFYLMEKDYISIVKDGAGVGRIFYCEGKTSVLGTLDMISPIANINTYFIYCLLNNIDFTQFVTGSTIPHIYYKDYSKVICGIPCLEEQTKIANFLSSIDEKIELVNTQIQNTQEYKKGLLQQMFV